MIGYEVVVGGGYCFKGTWDRGRIVNETVFDLDKYHESGRRENVASRRPTIEFPIVQEVVALTRDKEPYSHHVDEFEECLRILGDPGPAAPPADDCASSGGSRRRPLDLRAENREWLFIRQTIDDYRERMSSKGPNEALSIFSRQLQNLVDLSLEGRDEAAGAWSGELARQSLLFIARQLEAEPDFGVELVRGSDCSTDYCRVERLGDEHIERHVAGFFRELGRKVLSEAVARPCPAKVRERLVRELGRIRRAHVLLVERAVSPGFERIPELNTFEAAYAKFDVRGKAMEARQRGLTLALRDMATSGVIDSSLAEGITKEYLQGVASDIKLPSIPEYDDE